MAVTRRDADFEHRGTRCAAWLYRDDAADDPPVVVLADAFGTERSWGAPAFAERFAERGLAVLSFDYRGFGDSGGEPRGLISPRSQVRDLEAAVAHARSLDAVDATRLALWGSSYGAGHALTVAARDAGVDAVVLQVPFTDGVRTVLNLTRRGGPSYAVRALLATVRDVGRWVTGRRPYSVPIAAEPDAFGALNTPGTLAGYESIVDGDWDNRCAARAFLTSLVYRPVRRAGRVACPALVVDVEADTIVLSSGTDRLVSRLADVERLTLPGGHFDVYTGEGFEAAVSREADFLARHVLG